MSLSLLKCNQEGSMQEISQKKAVKEDICLDSLVKTDLPKKKINPIKK